MNEDLDHLRLLSIFHYVVGGLAGLIACVPVVHVVLGVLFVTGWFPASGGEPPPPLLGWVLIVVGSLIVVVGWSLAVCVLIAGRYLARHTHYVYCLALAAIECCWFPFGTVLGVFTIIVLMRPSVKALFGRGVAPRMDDR